MFSCCFSCIFIEYFCAARVDVKQGGGQILTSNQCNVLNMRGAMGYSISVQGYGRMSLDGSPKAKTVYGKSSKLLFKQKWGIPKVYSFSPFWLGQIYHLKVHRILLKVKTFQKTSPSGISTNTIPGPTIICKLYANLLYHNNA